MNAEEIAGQELLQAVKNCSDEVQEEVLTEYENLLED